jgi:acetate kinase
MIHGQGRIDSAVDTLPILDDWLGQLDKKVSAVAHRIVHGGPNFTQHCLATEEAIAKLREAKSLAPEHLPAELDLLGALRTQFPGIPHILCFDTAFHASLSKAAFTFALPQRITQAGVRRYGFHGLSYEYLVDWLRDHDELKERCILAHLGNGCSMAAVQEGKSVDTTMGFTPAGGLVMGSRCGDIDPGIIRFLSDELGIEPAAIDRLVNHESGMLGVSGISGDVRQLMENRGSHLSATLALEIFTRTAKKHLCALAGVLGGADRIVFSGGIGENSPFVRQAILSNLEFLGIRLDFFANERSRSIISAPDSEVGIFIVPANEEAAMAQIVRRLLSLSS